MLNGKNIFLTQNEAARKCTVNASSFCKNTGFFTRLRGTRSWAYTVKIFRLQEIRLFSLWRNLYLKDIGSPINTLETIWENRL